MRAVIQRVLQASVTVDGSLVSQIGPGLLVLVGIRDTDTEADAEFLCRKLVAARLFTNAATGRAWDRSVVDENLSLLLVSQFTLYGGLKKPRPDFHYAMPPQLARPFYDAFVARVRAAYRPDRVLDGVFGAMMQVALVNDGPVTLTLDSCTDGPGSSGHGLGRGVGVGAGAAGPPAGPGRGIGVPADEAAPGPAVPAGGAAAGGAPPVDGTQGGKRGARPASGRPVGRGHTGGGAGGGAGKADSEVGASESTS